MYINNIIIYPSSYISLDLSLSLLLLPQEPSATTPPPTNISALWEITVYAKWNPSPSTNYLT